MRHSAGKKRKADQQQLELEKTLYSSFVTAANSISQLYSQASSQQRQSREAGARIALERVYSWLVRGYGQQAAVPTADLLEFLRSELQNCDANTAENAPPVGCTPQFPLAYFNAGLPSPAKRQDLGQGTVPPGGATADMQHLPLFFTQQPPAVVTLDESGGWRPMDESGGHMQ